MSEKDTKKLKEVAEKFAALGIEEPRPLFKDKNYAKAAFVAFCFYKFGDYTVGEPKIDENKGEVEVSFLSTDFLLQNEHRFSP